MTAKRLIRSHKGGRTARAPEARMTPQEKARLDTVLQQRGVKHTDWYIGHVNQDYQQITGGNTMVGKWCVSIFDKDERGELLIATIDSLPTRKACIAEAETWKNKTRYEITNPQGKVTSIKA